MVKLRKLTLPVMLAVGVMGAGSAYAGGVDRAAILANTCAGCHGPDGVSTGPAAPTIAGLPEEYFIDVMNMFKEGERRNTIMGRIAKGYSDEEIELMAKYFAKLPHKPAKQSFDPVKAKYGKKLHDKYCEKCHEEGGRLPDSSGPLAGQWKPYLQFTLNDFINGHSTVDKKMKKKLDKLVKKEGMDGIKAVLEYYASQQK